MKVSRQCPLVLLVNIGKERVWRSNMEKIER
jgi:hypothetical protein